MKLRSFARVVALIFAAASVFPATAAEQLTLLNVSYDPTRELWRDINEHFIADYKAKTGIDVDDQAVARRLEHAGARRDRRTRGRRRDARLVHRHGCDREGGLIKRRLGRSPAESTRCRTTRRSCSWSARAIRRGIKDWPDLVKPGVEIITPNPKTSGNG